MRRCELSDEARRRKRERDRAWREANREKCAEKVRAWREAHRERVLEAGRAYYHAHREERMAYNQTWKERNRKKPATSDAAAARAERVDSKDGEVGKSRRAYLLKLLRAALPEAVKAAREKFRDIV